MQAKALLCSRGRPLETPVPWGWHFHGGSLGGTACPASIKARSIDPQIKHSCASTSPDSESAEWPLARIDRVALGPHIQTAKASNGKASS